MGLGSGRGSRVRGRDQFLEETKEFEWGQGPDADLASADAISSSRKPMVFMISGVHPVL